MNLWILLLVFSFFLVAVADGILCTSSFCNEWLLTNTCVDLHANCQIQNGTHNGIFLPFAGPCHCCDYCVVNLAKGESCSIGTPASPVPRVICGDMLYCMEDGDDNTCQTIKTNCSEDQSIYNEKRNSGTLGHLELKPNCQRRGLYEPFKCIPGEICYCVDEEGMRIFGDMPYTTIASSIMHCACSRNYEKAVKYLGRNLYNTQFLRCKANGDYDPLQCMDDDCFCVHPADGTLAVTPTSVVNVTSISNETLSCFDNKTHIEGEYYRECEAKVAEILTSIKEYEAMGMEVIGYNPPNCQLDGYYAIVQQNSTHKYCSDRDGNPLEEFIIDINDEIANDMDCNCARSRHITIADKPECLQNGNYKELQCRRGLCRCVDNNGIQLVPEVSFLKRTELPCYNDLSEEEGTTTVKEEL
ncbi:hypothetical protein Trydic_g2134 [Trypoxylus dichotomus]